MPAAVRARPRDSRGYPVPAITPWEDGVPRFAVTGVARTFLCAVERRCSICGGELGRGLVWRVVGSVEAQAMAEAGGSYRNQAPTSEAPGHRGCMLYAATVCPYLARPNARRGQNVAGFDIAGFDIAGFDIDRGSARGSGGAVAGFTTYEFEYARGTGSSVVLFQFSGLRELLRHELGEEQLPELTAAIDAESGTFDPAPAYLLDDEAAAQRQFSDYLDGFPI